ncbi:hypothetical protein HLB30_05895 [Peptostreptococcus russellii]|uniref:ABC-2 family transporter protein n=1 Tax=Peptostreptococcus russellii TaxID=215200 RepID=A0A1H8GR34_9FIRM|nr:hypothetical protein [Peptostreptococcus russellii]MBC2578051.1 hypothetical protein [Peptostreptococcus russellii]SEN46280.1 hypothetical protein SAMN05216454_10471 [Peptostreptococcus russellii]
MLGKLIKHEFKACSRYFLPIYVALLLVFLLNGFTVPKTSDSVISLIMIILLTSVTLLFMFINIYVTVKRFSSSVYGEEGYLTNTLPVTSNQIIASKAITILIYSFLSTIVLGLAILLLLTPNLSKINILNFSQFINDAMKVISSSEINVTLTIINFILVFIVSTVSATIFIYFSISVAHLKQCINHKYIYGFVTYFVLSAVESGVSNLILNHTVGKTPPSVATNDPVIIINAVNTFFNSTFLLSSVISLIFTILAWIAIDYMMKNKLNLE